ncbi:MAG: signal peptidase II [Lutisporaceae bacterium]
MHFAVLFFVHYVIIYSNISKKMHKGGMTVYPILIIAAIIAADQFSKSLAVANLMDKASITVIERFLSFTYVENVGMAFGLFKNQRLFFIISTSLIAIVVLYFIFKMYKKYLFISICLAMIFGGAIGNLIDRIRLGYVVDFIHFRFFPPVFNIADSAVVVGAIALSIAILFTKET